MNPATALELLADRVREEGPPLQAREPAAGGERDPAESALGRLAAAGPGTTERGDRYAFVVEAVREGYLCHYGTSRVLADPDPDLALLAGDLFYAIGISELAALEDLESTGILSDLIRGVAELHAAGRPELAETLWLAQIVALSCGKDATLDGLLDGLEAGQWESAKALADWSRGKASSAGLGREFDIARTAIDSGPSNS